MSDLLIQNVMTEEEKKMRDNIALVAMQCILRRKVKLSLFERVYAWFKNGEYVKDPDDVAIEAYEYAQCMMDERRKVIKNEEV